MSYLVQRRAGAQRDLIEIYRRYARRAGIRVADRFLASAEATFQRLARMPGIGTQYEHNHPALEGLRVHPLSSRFKVHLVFYQPIPAGIEIVHVLHGARNFDGILIEEFDNEDTDDERE